METIDILNAFLPSWLFDYVYAIKINDSLDQIDIYLKWEETILD